jgi:hypothetical protein
MKAVAAKRKPINVTDTVGDVLVTLSEGNPGGLDVLTRLVKSDQFSGVMRILDLDDMDIRGPLIWILWKDICNHDLQKVIDFCISRDARIVARLNEAAVRAGEPAVAVTGGASRR